MNRNFMQTLSEYFRNKKSRRRWAGAASVLSLVVVVCVLASLVRPAITMTEDGVDSIEEIIINPSTDEIEIEQSDDYVTLDGVDALASELELSIDDSLSFDMDDVPEYAANMLETVPSIEQLTYAPENPAVGQEMCFSFTAVGARSIFYAVVLEDETVLANTLEAEDFRQGFQVAWTPEVPGDYRFDVVISDEIGHEVVDQSLFAVYGSKAEEGHDNIAPVEAADSEKEMPEEEAATIVRDIEGDASVEGAEEDIEVPVGEDEGAEAAEVPIAESGAAEEGIEVSAEIAEDADEAEAPAEESEGAEEEIEVTVEEGEEAEIEAPAEESEDAEKEIVAPAEESEGEEEVEAPVEESEDAEEEIEEPAEKSEDAEEEAEDPVEESENAEEEAEASEEESEGAEEEIEVPAEESEDAEEEAEDPAEESENAEEEAEASEEESEGAEEETEVHEEEAEAPEGESENKEESEASEEEVEDAEEEAEVHEEEDSEGEEADEQAEEESAAEAVEEGAEAEAEEAAEEEIEEEAEDQVEATEFTFEGENYSLTARVSDAAQLPEGAALRVEVLEDEDYEAARAQALAALGTGEEQELDETAEAEAEVTEATDLDADEPLDGEAEDAADQGAEEPASNDAPTVRHEITVEDAWFFTAALEADGEVLLPEDGVTLMLTVAPFDGEGEPFISRSGEIVAFQALEATFDNYNGEVVGFGRAVTSEVPVESEPEAEKEPEYQDGALVYPGDGYTVTLSYTAEAEIPVDAELAVREIQPGSAEYALYSDRTDAALDENWDVAVAQPRFFDITILLDDEEIQPAVPVSVRIDFADAVSASGDGEDEPEKVQAIHFDENDDATLLSAESHEPEEAAEAVSFDAESFSVYGVVPTATLTTKVITAEGKTFVIDVTYGQDAALPEGAKLLADEITAESDPEKYEEYTARSAAALTGDPAAALALARLFDIAIVDASGIKVEPEDSVTVEIRMQRDYMALPEDDESSAQDESEIAVVHFAENGTEVLPAEASGEESDTNVVCFETDSFSVFVVVKQDATGSDPLQISGESFAIVSDVRFGAEEDQTDSHAALYAQPDGGKMLSGTIELDERTAYSSATDWTAPTLWTFVARANGYSLYTFVDGAQRYLNIGETGLTLSESQQALSVERVAGTADVYQIGFTSNSVTYSLYLNYSTTTSEGETTYTDEGFSAENNPGTIANTYVRLCTANQSAPSKSAGAGEAVENDRMYVVINANAAKALDIDRDKPIYNDEGVQMGTTPGTGKLIATGAVIQDTYKTTSDAQQWRFKRVAANVPYVADGTTQQDSNYQTRTVTGEDGTDKVEPVIQYYVCTGSGSDLKYLSFNGSTLEYVSATGNQPPATAALYVERNDELFDEERYLIYYQAQNSETKTYLRYSGNAFGIASGDPDSAPLEYYMNFCSVVDSRDSMDYVIRNVGTNLMLSPSGDGNAINLIAYNPNNPVGWVFTKSPYSENVYYIRRGNQYLMDNYEANNRSGALTDEEGSGHGHKGVPDVITCTDFGNINSTWVYDAQNQFILTNATWYGKDDGSWAMQQSNPDYYGSKKLVVQGNKDVGYSLALVPKTDSVENNADKFDLGTILPTLSTEVVTEADEYAIVNAKIVEDRNDRVRAAAMSNVRNTNNAYLLNEVVYLTKSDMDSGIQYVFSDLNDDPTSQKIRWHFVKVQDENGNDKKSGQGNQLYYIYSINASGEKEYLKQSGGNVNSNNLVLTSWTSGNAPAGIEFQIVPSAKPDMYYIRNSNGNKQLNLDGGSPDGQGFHLYDARENGDDRILLCKYIASEPADPQYATKVSVSELQETGSIGKYVVIYLREVDANGVETLYALDGDGNFVKLFDHGSQIGWRENLNSGNSKLWWEFSVLQSDGQANGYYGFKNALTGRVLRPQASGFLLDDGSDVTKNGVSLTGRDAGDYGSTIIDWDKGAGSYYSLALNVGKTAFENRQGSDGDVLYFAQINQTSANDLPTVATVDSNALGITIKMFDYDRDNRVGGYPGHDVYVDFKNGTTQSGILGGGSGDPFEPGIVKNVLGTDGYPVLSGSDKSNGQGEARKTEGTSLQPLFTGNNVLLANHLFLQSVYDATGYLEYSSFENYAYLNGTDRNKEESDTQNGNFTVYQNVGSPYWTNPGNDAPHSFYLTRGNFMPYNNLTQAGLSQSLNYYLHDADGNPLDPNDPRFGEKVYLIEEPNYFNGMLMEATFYQTKDGMSYYNPSEPTVYEFNGDDDLWIFIDGVLVLDIGGIHDAHSGTINFATGRISYAVEPSGSNLPHTIYEAFVAAKGQEWVNANLNLFRPEVGEGGSTVYRTFADYSAHTFKMFYMERGAGASNLHMRFNLATVEPGHFTVGKHVSVQDSVAYQKAYNDQEYTFKVSIRSANGVKADESSAEQTSAYVTVTSQTQCKSGGTYKKVTATKKKANGSEEKITIPASGEFKLRDGESVTFDVGDPGVEYKVEELNVDTGAYSVRFDGSATAATVVENVASTEGKVETKPQTDVENVVTKTGALEIRKSIAKNGVDEKFQAAIPDSRFAFRVSFWDSTSGASGVWKPYSVGDYYVMQGEKYYTYQGGNINNALVEASGKTVASQSSQNGIISGIPAGYTVRIEGLLPGTKFKVAEEDIPDGFELDTYAVTEAEATQQTSTLGADAGAYGTIKRSEGNGVPTATVTVTNAPRVLGFTLKKVDADAPSTALNDVEFKLYYWNGETNDDKLQFVPFTQTVDSETSDRSFTTSGENDNAGTISFANLPVNQYYKLVEVTPQAGYVLGGSATTYIRIDKDGAVSLVNEAGTMPAESTGVSLESSGTSPNITYTLTVPNERGRQLPATGGAGTLWLRLGGSIMAAVFASIYWFGLRRRKGRGAARK